MLHERQGAHSPLAAIEPSIVEIILSMPKFCQYLSSPEIKDLIDSCIDGTEYQKKLITFKKNRVIRQDEDEDLGRVGLTYVQAFMKQWGHKIKNRKPHHFELDHANWTNFANFRQMYDCIEEKLMACNLAQKLDQPVWMAKAGNIINKEEEAYGLPCTIHITHPELCIVADGVGSNTYQTGDGHVGGHKLVCASKSIPQAKSSNNQKHFTV